MQATVDVFLADMLIPYMAMARGNSAFLARTIQSTLNQTFGLWKKC